jgi:hypothetical protein
LPWIGKVRLQDITAIDCIWCSLLISFAMYYVVSDLILSPDSKIQLCEAITNEVSDLKATI